MVKSRGDSESAEHSARALDQQASLLGHSLGNGRFVAPLHVLTIALLAALFNVNHPHGLLWLWVAAAYVYAGLRIWQTVYGERALSRGHDAATARRQSGQT